MYDAGARKVVLIFWSKALVKFLRIRYEILRELRSEHKEKPAFLWSLTCSRSLMDKMLVCGTSAPGSIPGESTKAQENPLTIMSGDFLITSQQFG